MTLEATQTQQNAQATTPDKSGILQRKCACGNHTVAGGECAECREKRLQRKATGHTKPEAVPPIVPEVLHSPGRLLDAETQTFMEPRFGRDFSRIPTHPPAVGVIQTKLAINKPGDEYEQEADRIADQVMAAPAHPAVSGAPPRIQRFSGQSNGQMDAAPVSVEQALASSGRPLEPTLRRDMEHRFGHDFSRVRVHSGGAAEQSARELNANAYTLGHDIVFGAGRFAPATNNGRRLLAHELTHVVQQGKGLRLQIQRQLTGCQNLIPAPAQAVGVGIAVHQAIETHFSSSVTGVPEDKVRIPGASAAPDRTQGLCGRDENIIRPQISGGQAGDGLPDLARIGPGGVLQVAEIKPATEPCLIDGETQLARYIDQGNERDAVQVAWRNSLGIKVVSPMLASTYSAPTLPFGRCQIQTAWCTAGLLAYAVSCPPRRRQEPEQEQDLNVPLLATVAALLGLSTAVVAWPRAKAPTVPTTTPRTPTVSVPQPTQQPQAPSPKPKPTAHTTRRPHQRPRADAGTKAGAGTRGHRPGSGARARPPRVSPRVGGRTGGIPAPSGGGALRVGGGLLALLSLYGAYKTIKDAEAHTEAMLAPYEALWDEFEKQRAAGNRGDDTAAVAAQPTPTHTPPRPEPEPPRKPPEKETRVRLFKITRSRLSEREASVPSASIGTSYFPVEFFSLTRPGERTTAVGGGQIDCSRIHKGIAGVSGYQRYTGYARARDVSELNKLFGFQIGLEQARCVLRGRGPQPAAQPDGDEISVTLSASGESVTATCKKLAGASGSTCTSEGNFASMKALMDDPELEVPPDFVLEVAVVRTRNGESQRSDSTITVWVENPDHPAPEPSVQADGSVPADASDWKAYSSGSEIAYLLELYSRWGP